jgi:(p)ppGpp synthase/HD superfamily hydrolase
VIGPRFDQAVELARELHTTQRRTGTQIPYLAHLLGVASLVIEDGGSEDEAIAALLHDAVEDQGGPETRDRIREQFGDRIAEIVDGCTDTDQSPKPPWLDRKKEYIAHLADVDKSTLRVSLADKLHNARSIHFDLLSTGDAVWARFTAGRDGQLWYYEALADAFEAKNAGPMVAELRRTVANIRADSS